MNKKNKPSTRKHYKDNPFDDVLDKTEEIFKSQYLNKPFESKSIESAPTVAEIRVLRDRYEVYLGKYQPVQFRNLGDVFYFIKKNLKQPTRSFRPSSHGGL